MTKNVIRKYYLICFLILLLYVAIITPIIWFYNSFWSILCCALLYLPVKALVRITANETIASVLFKDLDAFAFKKIINDKRFIPPLVYRINAAITTGDYEAVINIATKQLQKKKCSVMTKHVCLSLLARSYFELRDYEKLKTLVIKHEELKKQYPKKSIFRTPNTMWSYYRYFLDKNFEACKTVCNERNLQLKPKAWDTKIRALQNDFYYAVACYENEDTDLAKESFIVISSAAPKMYLSSLANLYLEAVEHCKQPCVRDAEVLPDVSFQTYNTNALKRKQRHKVFMEIAICIAVVLFAARTVLDYIYQKEYKEVLLYESKLNDALIEKYDKATWISHLGLTKDDRYVDSLCLANDNNSLVLVNVTTSDGEETFEVLEIAKNIVLDSYYCVKSLASNYYIGFEVSSSEPPTDSLYYSFEFEHKNNTYWFYIDYVETTPKVDF